MSLALEVLHGFLPGKNKRRMLEDENQRHTRRSAAPNPGATLEKSLEADSSWTRAAGANPSEGHRITIDANITCIHPLNKAWFAARYTHRTRKHVSPQEPQSTANCFSLRMQVPHSFNEGLSTMEDCFNGVTIGTLERVFWVFNDSFGKETPVEIQPT